MVEVATFPSVFVEGPVEGVGVLFCGVQNAGIATFESIPLANVVVDTLAVHDDRFDSVGSSVRNAGKAHVELRLDASRIRAAIQ
jgi:hypothetical protein